MNVIKDSYQGLKDSLKDLIKNRFADKDKADSSTILDKYEKKPEKTKPLLEDD